jgi:ABC-2 type transport system permease protein
MLKYLALTRLAIQRQFIYRAATLAGLATNVFFGLLRAAVMVALFGARTQVSGMSVQDAITYTGLSQACIAFLSLFSWFEIIQSVDSGQVGADLLKPMDYFLFWGAQDLGKALVNLALRGLTIMVFYALVFQISVPDNPAQWIALCFSVILAWMISFGWRFLTNLSAFWSPNSVGICRLFYALSWFMSGFFMPLRFMPDWFVRLCALTPFPSMINTTIEVYLGLLKGPELLQALFTQAAWALGLALLGQLVLRSGVRRLVIQGG